MRGGHDLGGRQGFGPIDPEPESEEPVFHDEWERRVFAMTLAAGMLGRWNIDQSRHARERQHPVAYLSQSYYENWLAGTERLLLETGLISEEELRARAVATQSGKEPRLPAAPAGAQREQSPRISDAATETACEQSLRIADAATGTKCEQSVPAPQAAAATQCVKGLRIPDAAAARKILGGGGPTVREIESPPRFAIGDEVIAQRRHVAGHTRAPAYAQGCRGLVRERHGAHIFPDANCAGDPVAHHLYSVEFASRELWGSDAEPFDVLIDLWEPYLACANDNDNDNGDGDGDGE